MLKILAPVLSVFLLSVVAGRADDLIADNPAGHDIVVPDQRQAQSRAAAPAFKAVATASGITAQFRYDSLGRLVQESFPTNSGSYTYDAAGNRVSATAQ